MKQIKQAFARLNSYLKQGLAVAGLVFVFHAGLACSVVIVPELPKDGLSGQSILWGFFAHQRINRLAVFMLPPEMFGFYKLNIDFLAANAVNADRRRYAVPREAPRHFIDLDNYADSVRNRLPAYSWKEAVERVGEDTLYLHGIVPWHINAIKYQLTEAFRKKDVKRILSLSADLGHYIADAHVPLHTTRNYNGQLTNQVGIHGLWESRLPVLFAENYDLMMGQATYEEHPDKRAWQAIITAHTALDSVLILEKGLSNEFSEDKKYSFEEVNNVTTRVYSRAFSARYHTMLKNQVERQMRASIKMIGDFWFTCWVDAGQPDLGAFKKYEPNPKEEEEEKTLWLKRLFEARKESDN
ncbi:zinc dependent phospholipase C family protein [Emticicia sp. 21SJ11W-3]|uniref:zinc dependent phospholipase C family protein n=1 Tax=Emticicia sp. 21SJ11W-3 TaxID=2916755 RepID=UPI0020A0A173|nr:zinc dependent phospholipase C family protein [Emticicia sp. 21SJ11W-3]UTA69505.1 zinc dependent phospholipase C family protein [Emticicia sp. 21SJ11W-3]